MRRKSLYLIFIIIFLMAVVKVFAAARLATTGNQLSKVETYGQKINQENLLLEEEIASLSSLNRIASEAGRLGLGKSVKVVSFVPEVPIALRTTY